MHSTGSSSHGSGESYDLTAVVPMYNAAATIQALADQFLATDGVDVQVILVDDRSTDDTATIADQLAAAHHDVLVLRHEQNRGAGVARNTGFARAAGRYTLFFDADDHVDPAVLGHIVDRLDTTGADVAMTAYRYRRSTVVEADYMNPNDQDVWQEVLGSEPERLSTLAQVPRILEFTNYPWNKVVRTSTYTCTDLRFGTTPVHNDILGHWHTLLFANRILLLDEILCTHIVEPGRENLTNRSSADRLTLFHALDETLELLRSDPARHDQFSDCYWAFVNRLTNWATGNLDPALSRQYREGLSDHLLRMTVEEFATLRVRRSSNLVDRIMQKAIT